MITTVKPGAPYDTDPVLLTALCVWREARGESYEAKLGVVWVLRNRCRMAPAQGFAHDMAGNVLKPFAFSSFNSNDPNSSLYPAVHDSIWQDCIRAAQSDEADPTGGAVFYYSHPLTEAPKGWGDTIQTAKIDGLTFCGFSEVVT